MNRNIIDNLKYKEYDIVSGIKLQNYNNPKTHKIGHKISLQESIQSIIMIKFQKNKDKKRCLYFEKNNIDFIIYPII